MKKTIVFLAILGMLFPTFQLKAEFTFQPGDFFKLNDRELYILVSEDHLGLSYYSLDFVSEYPAYHDSVLGYYGVTRGDASEITMAEYDQLERYKGYMQFGENDKYLLKVHGYKEHYMVNDKGTLYQVNKEDHPSREVIIMPVAAYIYYKKEKIGEGIEDLTLDDNESYLPDFSFESFVVNGVIERGTGHALSMDLCVKNIGNVILLKNEIKFYNNETEKYFVAFLENMFEKMPSLKAGESWCGKFYTPISSVTGDKLLKENSNNTISVFFDKDNFIKELNDDNNEISYTFFYSTNNNTETKVVEEKVTEEKVDLDKDNLDNIDKDDNKDLSDNSSSEVVDNGNKVRNLSGTTIIKNSSMHAKLKGKILLKVEDSGKAYYINPRTESAHYLGRPDDAFRVMREQGVGIANKDLYKIPVGVSSGGLDSDGDGLPDNLEEALGLNPNKADTDGDGYNDKEELINGYNPWGPGKQNIDNLFSGKQKGKIFLQVEKNGEAWYVNPEDGRRYFLGRPADAFSVMRNLGLGISNTDFNKMIE